jgi:hypothetical protein
MFRDQIEAGTALLDEKIGPAWLDRQNLSRFCLSDTRDCVVGQSQPDVDYIDTLMHLFQTDDDQEAINKAHIYGFAISPDGNYADYETLTEEWKAYIQERRSQKTAIEQVP